MFNMFKKPVSGKKILLQLGGLHCTSCSMNIDFALEDIPGVKEAKTIYASQRSTVIFDPKHTSEQTIVNTITSLGYTAVVER